MRILFLTPRLPYPPVKGDTLRVFHIIKHLSESHEILLLSLIGREEERRNLAHLETYCSKVETVLLGRYRSYLNVMGSLFSDTPFQVSYFSSPLMRERLRTTLREERVDLIHAVLLRSAHYVMRNHSLPKVVDLIDALSLNMERRYRREKGFKRLAFREEWKRVRSFEKEVCRSFDKATVVSEMDRVAIGEGNVEVVPNGVDTELFKPSTEGREGHLVIFTGNMGYFPNRDAVFYFREEILPMIVQQIPGLRFLIVGANPPRGIVHLGEDPRIVVTGFVDSVGDYLQKASVAVCPMRCGSGMQNKVLEAMACGTPVVATSLALEGIQATPGEHALVGDTPEAFADHVIALLRDAERSTALARKARELVEQRYSWRSSASRLECVYQEALAHWRSMRAAESLQARP